MVEDVDESPFVYGYLCDLIEANHPLILGPENSNIPRIIAIFAEAFSVEAISQKNEVYKRMVNITKQVQVRKIYIAFTSVLQLVMIFFLFRVMHKYLMLALVRLLQHNNKV